MMLSAVLQTLSHLRTWSTLTSMICGPLFRIRDMNSTSLNEGLGMTPTAECSSISHHAQFTLHTMVPGTQTASMQKASRLYISLLVL